MTETCVVCGKKFTPVVGNQKICSLKCKLEAAKINRQFRNPRKSTTPKGSAVKNSSEALMCREVVAVHLTHPWRRQRLCDLKDVTTC